MHKIFLIPKAFAPRISDCIAILLRSLHEICIIGSIPLSSSSLDIAKLHILIIALLPSVTLTACTLFLRSCAILRDLMGSPPLGGINSAVITFEFFSKVC